MCIRDSYVYEWDPNLTKINSVTLSWAAETSGWLAGTGQVVADVMLNSVIMDRHEFTTPGTYANTIDITSAFFNGPNVFRPWFFFQWLPNLTWITCKMRIDILVDYIGLGPRKPINWEQAAPYVAGGVVLGTLLYFLLKGRGRK